jgi:hypothetical protein
LEVSVKVAGKIALGLRHSRTFWELCLYNFIDEKVVSGPGLVAYTCNPKLLGKQRSGGSQFEANPSEIPS